MHPSSSFRFSGVGSLPVSLTSMASTTNSFEPIVPDETTLLGFGIVVVVCAIAAFVWSNQVVPISRTKLALAKQRNSNSELRQYLDELQALELNSTGTSQSREVTESVDADLSVETMRNTDMQSIDSTLNPERTNNRAFERWLFTDWLVQDQNRKSGRQKEPAIPILKSAKWNSGDNPVLAATALILSGVLLTAITERIANSL